MPESKELTFLYDQDGELHGVLLSPELWEKTQDVIQQYTSSSSIKELQEACEPMKDWDCLLSYWDFQYPPTSEVCCNQCGSSTDDWTKDSPRKFTLRAANLGGLVRFRCNNCKASITKRHFKDQIKCECKPFDGDC